MPRCRNGLPIDDPSGSLVCLVFRSSKVIVGDHVHYRCTSSDLDDRTDGLEIFMHKAIKAPFKQKSHVMQIVTLIERPPSAQ